jgi:LPXTG-motif cell wall-anchored protein
VVSSDEVIITNSKSYTLPDSGGVGTKWFTLSGMTIIIAASFMYILLKNKRKEKRAGEGGDA